MIRKTKRDSYRGVGFPNVFRRCPETLFSGFKYSFSKISFGIMMLPAVSYRWRSIFGSEELEGDAPLVAIVKDLGPGLQRIDENR
jgi:hypothetical protein